MEYSPEIKFDTHKMVRRLVNSGLKEKTAEVVVEAIQDASSSGTSALVTRVEFKAETTTIRHEIAVLHQKIDTVATLLNQKIDSKIESLEHKLTVKMGAMIFTAVATLGGTQLVLKFFF